MRQIRTILLVALAVLVFASAAMATVAWSKAFKDTYKPNANSALGKAKCGACHVKANGTGGLNSYGKMLDNKTVNAASLKAIESKDADKDGASNIKEIKAGTLPGSASSCPPKS